MTKYFIKIRDKNLLEHARIGFIFNAEIDTFPKLFEQEEIAVDNIRYTIHKQEHKLKNLEDGEKEVTLMVYVC